MFIPVLNALYGSEGNFQLSINKQCILPSLGQNALNTNKTNNKTASQGCAVLSGILHIVGNIICDGGNKPARVLHSSLF